MNLNNSHLKTKSNLVSHINQDNYWGTLKATQIA
jgi:hypothetical protein